MLAVLAVAVASALALSVGTAAAGSGLFGYSSPAATIIQRSIDEALDEHRAEQRATQGQDAPDPAEVDTAEADAGEADTAEADAPEADAGEADVPEADTAESDAPEADAGEADAPEAEAAPEPPSAQPPADLPPPPPLPTPPAPTPEPPVEPEAEEPPAEEPAPEPPAEEPEDCQCLPETDPEYVAAKAHFEATKAWTRPVIAEMQAAADASLEALYEFGRVRKGLRDVCGDCWDHPDVVAAKRVMDERASAYSALRGPAKAAANAYNAALERWDRARDLAKVNLP